MRYSSVAFIVAPLEDTTPGYSACFNRYCSAPDGQRATCAATSAAAASSGRTQRLRRTSNTAGSPRTHTPEWMYSVGSNVTVMPGASYTWRRLDIPETSTTRGGAQTRLLPAPDAAATSDC